MKKLILSVLASVALSAGVTHEIVRSAPAVAEAKEMQRFNELRQATWRVEMMSGNGIAGFCSGTAIAPDMVLTAAHCDPTDMGFTLQINGHRAQIAKKDTQKDLMLLHVPGLNSPVVKVEHLVPGPDHKVLAVGFPFGLALFITEGKVQGNLDVENLAAGGVFEHYLGVSAMVVGGNSGGGLYTKNKDGEYVLIGVVSRSGGTVTLICHPDEVEKFLHGVEGPK